MTAVTITDNYLPQETHALIHDLLLGPHFPWYFNDAVNHEDEAAQIDRFQFTHTFYSDDRPNSDLFHVVAPLWQPLNVLSLIRVKANLVTFVGRHYPHGMHEDYEDPRITTAVYYVNSNNGYTVFESGERVDSVANRLVTFQADSPHSGTTCTDKSVRCVININYLPML